MSALAKRIQALLSVLSVLALIVLAAFGIAWWVMRESLPLLDGERAVAAISAPVRIERDAQGVPTIGGASRRDAAHGLGFAHAQDRFFQMDLLRRRAAGELSELFGEDAVPIDKSARLHGFRRIAQRVIEALPADHRGLLEAYAAGVNEGLAALSRPPWEYALVRADVRPWEPVDSMLVSYAMWFDLQDAEARYEQSLAAFRRAHGAAALEFFAPRGTSGDAALDGSTLPVPALPTIRLRAPTAARASPGFDDEEFPGSNSFAVPGASTTTGAALLANDPHLGLSLPNIWYRASLSWTDENGKAHRVTGATVPGAPTVIIGSNGRVAWGFTNAYVDTTDIVVVETESTANSFYRSPKGWREIEERKEVINIKGGGKVDFVARWTDWGPILSGPEDNNFNVLRWTAHDADAVNLAIAELETAADCEEAVAIAHRIGMPNQNILIADADGRVAWTVTGKIPKRVGYDGRLPSSWAYGDRHWDGWLGAAETPVIASYERPGKAAAAKAFWTANNRIVGGEDYRRLGDGGYDDGLRASAIRDELQARIADDRKVAPEDLLAIQLDDRGRYLERWRELLLAVLTDDAVRRNDERAEVRELARAWQGRASIDSAGYRIIRGFRAKVIEQSLAPFLEQPTMYFPRFNAATLMTEDAVWTLIHEKPARLLNPTYRSWEALLESAVDGVIADADAAKLPLDKFTWGRRNTLRMQHPFSSFLPGFLARRLDMPYQQLPGDSNLPRVQSPRFGASHRMVVAPGHEADGIFEMPGGQAGHPLSPYYGAGHAAWAAGERAPFLPGPTAHTLTLRPKS